MSNHTPGPKRQYPPELRERAVRMYFEAWYAPAGSAPIPGVSNPTQVFRFTVSLPKRSYPQGAMLQVAFSLQNISNQPAALLGPSGIGLPP